jgi:hypothetical protein
MARRWAAAEDDADLALALEPAHVKARHSRGQARAALGFKRPALADLTHVLRAAPHAEPVRAGLGLGLGLGLAHARAAGGAVCGAGARRVRVRVMVRVSSRTCCGRRRTRSRCVPVGFQLVLRKYFEAFFSSTKRFSCE